MNEPLHRKKLQAQLRFAIHHLPDSPEKELVWDAAEEYFKSVEHVLGGIKSWAETRQFVHDIVHNTGD